MRSLFAFALVSTLALPQAAFSADMPTKAAPAPIAPSVYSWTGFYIGINGGYGWRDSSQVVFTPNDPYSVALLTDSISDGTHVVAPAHRLRGGFGGGQIGYNWQFSPNWLVGLEADFQGSSIDGSGTTTSILSAPGLTATTNADQHVRWFGTVRARLGYLPAANWLLYGTGGFAYGRVEESVNIITGGAGGGLVLIGIDGFNASCIGVPGAQPCFAGSSSRTATGWTAGGGVEYAFWKNLTVKAEYLYVNLGSGDSFTVSAQDPAPSTFTASFGRVDFHTVRAGLNYKF
jgi:outer membrane immunogenic protein